MKVIQNIASMSYKGIALTDENKEPLSTVSLVKTALENSSYSSAGDIAKAVKVVGKIVADESGDIHFEDADYEFVKKWIETYPPYLAKGLVFSEFLAQFE